MVPLLMIVWILLAVLVHTVVSFSSSPIPQRYEFRTYDFDSSGICRSPSSFKYKEQGKDTQYFVLRNVPGDGDW